MKYINLTFLVGMALSLFSCSRLKGNGDIIDTERDLSGFKGIEVNIPGNVSITRGDNYSYKMYVESNIDSYITTQVKDSILIIDYKNKNTIKSHKDINIHIMAPVFSSIVINGSSNAVIDTMSGGSCRAGVNGSGDISISHIKADNLNYSCNGSGNVKLASGNIHFKEITIGGSGNIKSENVLTTYSSIKINGSGDVYTHTTDSMYIRISGSGNVYYKGTPKINISAAGSGTAKPI